MTHSRSDVLGLVALVALLGLTFHRAEDVRHSISSADARDPIRSDGDLIESALLREDYGLVRALEERFVPGTPVSVSDAPELGSLWFQISLLPAYPIDHEAALKILPGAALEEDDEVLARSPNFVLVQRGEVLELPPGPTPHKGSRAVALLLWALAGLPVALVFARRRRWLLALGTWPLGGWLAQLLPAIGSAWEGVSLLGWGWKACLAGVLLAVTGDRLLHHREARRGDSETPPALPWTWKTWAAGAAVMAVSAAHLWTGVALELGGPIYGWDGWAIWLQRAKILGDSAAGYPIELTRNPELGRTHWDYPLLLPSVLGWFRRLGSLELQQLSWPLALLAAVVPLAGWLGLVRRVSAPWAAVAVLSPWAMAGLLYFHYGGYADGFLVALGTVGLLWCLAGVADDDPCQQLAGGLALAALVSTKGEGTLWALAHLLAVGALGFELGRGRRRSVGDALWIGWPALFFFGLWQLTLLRMGLDGGRVSNLDLDRVGPRLLPLARGMLAELFRPSSLPLLLPALLGLGWTARGAWRERARRVGVLLLGPSLYLAGLTAFYLLGPEDLAWLLSTSIDRVLFGVAPALLALALFAGRTPAPPREDADVAGSDGLAARHDADPAS
jgi:hypothetical protein